VQLGALIGDLSWAAAALSGLAVVVGNRPTRLLLGSAGACFLLWLAYKALRDAASSHLAQRSPEGGRGDFGAGLFCGLANPFAVPFWLGIGSGLVTTNAGNAQAGNFILLFLGFALGASCWVIGIAALLEWGRRFVGPLLFRLIDLACGLALGYFGLSLGWSMLQLVQTY